MASSNSKDNTFSVVFENFNVGAAPLAHLDQLTELGQSGNYSDAKNIDILTFPGFLTGTGTFTILTNGDENGAVTEGITFILDKPASNNTTYAIGTTKLHQLTNTTVTNTGAWPHAIANAAAGGNGTVVYFQGALYYFFTTASAGEIGKYDLASSFTDNWGSTVPTGAAALQDASYPVATKQDLMLFGNGRYVGVYNSTSNSLAPTKLDFGPNSYVADLCFNANQWWIAVNNTNATFSADTNRGSASIYLYDGSATSAILADEVGVGLQRIGFIMALNGIIYVAYQDLSYAGGYIIGYVKGRQLVPLRYYVGALPGYNQKTLFKNTILFPSKAPNVSDRHLYSFGAIVPQLPAQLSHFATPSYITGPGSISAVAAPFGTVLVGANGSTGGHHSIAALNGNGPNNNQWRSIVIPTIASASLGYIDRIIVITKTIASGGRVDLILEADQATVNSTTLQVTTVGETRHKFNNIGLRNIKDFRLFLNWNNSNSQMPVIRKIIVEGHYVEN